MSYYNLIGTALDKRLERWFSDVNHGWRNPRIYITIDHSMSAEWFKSVPMHEVGVKRGRSQALTAYGGIAKIKFRKLGTRGRSFRIKLDKP